VEFRLVFSQGTGRNTFSVLGRDAKERLGGLLQVVGSQLPEFGAEPAEEGLTMGSFWVPVLGVPEASVDPVGPLAKFFIENRLDGQYSITISPAHIDPFSRFLARRRQRALARDSAVQRHDEDTTSTELDHPKQVELEESVKLLERLSGRRPVRVAVLVSAEEKAVAERAARVLAGTVSSQGSISGLKVGRPRAGGWPRLRPSTLILPSEAATYLWLPQMSIGLKISPSAEFQLPPPMEGEIVLGEVVSFSGRNGQQVRVSLDQLAKHVFVTGMTGSGKTTSCFGLLLQLHRHGVPFLVIEPVKSEYRSLLAAIPDLHVFTIGDEETAPFWMNIFEPPPGVKVQAHLENLEAVWNASFVSYAPLPYVVKQVFAETYRSCGWDVRGNVRGRAVTFEDVAKQVERVVRGLGYERDVTMDLEAALKTRLTSLSLGGKGPLFGALSSTPLDAVLSRPTVIELKEIRNDEEKAFVAALLMMNLAAWVETQGWSRHLKHFTLIEEAHRLLPNVSTEKGDPESADPRRRLVEQFADMLAELRAYGEGLAVVEQIPTKILPDAIKNTATKVVHRVPARDDRKAMAGAMNATAQQAGVLTALNPGEAVLSVEGHPVPVRVEVEDVVAKLGVPMGEVSDKDVKRHMAGFYERYPLPRDTGRTVDEKLRELIDTPSFGDTFLQAYHTWLKQGEARPLRDLVVSVARRFTRDQAEVVDFATRILTLAVAFYLPYDADDRARFPELFRKELERSVSNARALR
jgi:DNA helicase HerA-like ATPase